jgi:acyl-CoA synthetase (AMP-forming)/AMP-acid ligase II
MLAVQKIREFAAKTPEAPALIADLTPISYRDFADRIEALRRAVAARRLGPGVAAIWIDSIPVAWVADLAFRSLGHTTLAVRSADDFASLGEIDIAVVVTSADERPAGLDPSVAPTAARIVIDRSLLDEPASGETPPLSAATGGHILLTSATTGRIKMVAREPAQDIAAYEAARPQYAQLVEATGRRVIVNYFNFGLWTAAGYGASILIWSYGQTVLVHQGPDPHLSLRVPGVAYAIATPAFLARILAAPPGSFPRNDDMQLSILGGALSEAMFHQVRQRLTNRITTSVGATEGGTWATTEVETVEDLRWHRLAPGREVEIVGEDDRPLPPGRLGQVRVAQADGVRGYLNDPQATAASFRGGYFYPGDLGVLDGKGRLALYGRVTDVLNVLGDKIPAAPLEEALQQALGVYGVCAFSEQDPDLAEALHIVVETPVPIDAARLRLASEAHLRGFPRVHFHFVDKLPRNHMGKVERLKLRRQLIDRRQAEATGR